MTTKSKYLSPLLPIIRLQSYVNGKPCKMINDTWVWKETEKGE